MEKPDLYSLLKQFNAIGGMAEIGQSGFCLIMALWQKSNELSWAKQFTMTNTELLYRSGYSSEKAMGEKRNRLMQLGYIKYIPPKNRRACGTYIMNFNLLDDYFLKHSSEHSINDDSDVGNHVSSNGGSEVDSHRNSEVNINKLNKTKLNKDNRSPLPPYEEIVGLYNSICVSLPKVTEISNSRKKIIKARWTKHNSLEQFREYFTQAEASEFLSGRNGKWGNCNFDWLINENNMIKVLEGCYDNKLSGGRNDLNGGLFARNGNIDGGAIDADPIPVKNLIIRAQDGNVPYLSDLP